MRNIGNHQGEFPNNTHVEWCDDLGHFAKFSYI